MLPTVTVAAGKFVVPSVTRRPVGVVVTVKGTPVKGSEPSPMSTVALPLKVALVTPTLIEPLLT
jgi:hypothetical protein